MQYSVTAKLIEIFLRYDELADEAVHYTWDLKERVQLFQTEALEAEISEL